MKTKLTISDTMRLDAARGLDLNASTDGRSYQNKSGLRPSVKDYNTAIRRGIYTGEAIAPIGGRDRRGVGPHRATRLNL